MLKTVPGILVFALMPQFAFANAIQCKIAASVDGKGQPDIRVNLPLDADQANCGKQSVYKLPGTSVEISMAGHGDCNPAPDFCPDVGPTIGSIEAYDRAAGNYAKNYGACTKVIDLMYLQFISNGKQRVNVVVTCKL